jgi:hypothetical protein
MIGVALVVGGIIAVAVLLAAPPTEPSTPGFEQVSTQAPAEREPVATTSPQPAPGGGDVSDGVGVSEKVTIEVRDPDGTVVHRDER